MVHLYAGTLPQFKGLTLDKTAAILRATAGKIALVETCCARIKLFPGAVDVTAASNGSQVAFCSHGLDFVFQHRLNLTLQKSVQGSVTCERGPHDSTEESCVVYRVRRAKNASDHV